MKKKRSRKNPAAGPVRLELLPPGATRRKRAAEAPPSTGPFDYPSVWVGKSGNVTVYAASALESAGAGLAARLLKQVTAPYEEMQRIFGIPGGVVNLILAPLSTKNDGSGGAYHYGCDFSTGGDLYVDAALAASEEDPVSLDIGLFVAELSESFMGAQNRGWGCGYSNGEALSRYCSELATPPGTMDRFATGPTWDQAGRPDWLSSTEQTDTDSISTGCGVVYLYWMRSQGKSSAQVAQAGGRTLAANYETLTGRRTAYKDLVAALKGRTIESDNPFAGQAMTAGSVPAVRGPGGQ